MLLALRESLRMLLNDTVEVPDRPEMEAFNYLQAGAASDEDKADLCPICQEVDTDKKVSTPCAHRFHPRCFSSLLRNHWRCPICRAALPPPVESPEWATLVSAEQSSPDSGTSTLPFARGD